VIRLGCGCLGCLIPLLAALALVAGAVLTGALP